MATNVEVRTRAHTLAVERLKIEKRKQQVEEQAHELEIRRYELEKIKIGVDVLKYVLTVITALLFILAYFGSQIIPILTASHFLGIAFWEWTTFGMYSSITFSLIGLLLSALSPENPHFRSFIQMMLFCALIAVFFASAFLISGLFLSV